MARDTSPAVTLSAYVAGLAVVFAAALGLGRAVGPVGVAADEPDSGHSTSHSTSRTGDPTGDPSGDHTSGPHS